MTVGKIENGFERGFVKRLLNCLLITDPLCFYWQLTKRRLQSDGVNIEKQKNYDRNCFLHIPLLFSQMT